MEDRMLEDAGRFLAPNWMVWVRRVNAPIADLWNLISTKEGLDEWWMCPVKIDLVPGGKFSHHWEDTIVEVKDGESIDFGSMRWEVKADGDKTIFSLIDSWEPNAKPQLPNASVEQLALEQPGGVGTPWAGVAAGWHCSVDRLYAAADGKPYENDRNYEALSAFYRDYLRQYFRWVDLVKERQRSLAS